MAERKHSPAEVRAFWQGYGAALTGAKLTGEDADLLLDPYFSKDNDALQKSVLNGYAKGEQTRRKRLKSTRKK